MSARTYRLSPLAEEDLEHIWLYTRQHWSLTQADSYYRDFAAAFEALAAGRIHGRAVEIRTGYLKYACGAHVIYFQDRGDRLDVIRILHGRMDADRHL